MAKALHTTDARDPANLCKICGGETHRVGVPVTLWNDGSVTHSGCCPTPAPFHFDEVAEEVERRAMAELATIYSPAQVHQTAAWKSAIVDVLAERFSKQT
jgi:hypothetical protein